jgi:hypothetical protein
VRLVNRVVLQRDHHALDAIEGHAGRNVARKDHGASRQRQTGVHDAVA